MRRLILKKNIIYLLYILPLIAIVFLTSLKATDAIVLKDEPFTIKPAGFYIADVTDERQIKTGLAQLVVRAAGNKTTTRSTDLQGGTVTAVSTFINHNLPKNTSLKAVVIGLKDFKVTEAPLPGNRVDGQVKLSISFGLQKEYGADQLVNYQGGFHYIRMLDNTANIETYVRKTLINSIVFFNDWMKANAPKNAKLARNVKFIFTDYTEPTEGDTIYYSAKRPLTWNDFQSKIAPRGPYAAAVMASIGYDVDTKIANSTIYVNIAMKAYVPKSSCWAMPTTRDDYSLNHEQRHFDIAKVIAEQYKQKVLAKNLTPDNYEAFISMQYLDSYRDMYAMQKAYDKETRNGRNEYTQSKWNNDIDKGLKTGSLLLTSNPLENKPIIH
jgi:hypothetical protein